MNKCLYGEACPRPVPGTKIRLPDTRRRTHVCAYLTLGSYLSNNRHILLIITIFILRNPQLNADEDEDGRHQVTR